MINFLFASVLREFLFLVVLPFTVWVITWWGFISGKLSLGLDAFYYYWDSRYFLDNISRGVYPLWNPEYNGGVPWHFFLRRLGEFNPFYWIISALKLFGASALHAHLIFLVLYYFLGLVAFWLLAKLFLKNRLTAIAAYLILLFTWGGQLFYCFDLFIFVPLMWFFYFIFAFGKEKKRHQFLGVIFSVALLITTYIPFFAITIIIFFLFFFFLFFMKESFDFLKSTFNFMRRHQFFTVIALIFFLLACAPGIGFYFESRGGGFVMPSRHLGSKDPSEVAVAVDTNSGIGAIKVDRTVWDIISSGYFDKVFSNQQDMNVGDFNIAYLFFIVIILGAINPVSRRTAFLLVTGVFLALIAMTKGRLYPFFLEHVFYFHFMRMMQLFLWLAVVPIAVLLVMEQLRVFLQNHQDRKNIKVLIFVVVVHVLFFIGLLMQQGIMWSSYLAVVMSLVFFILSLMGWGDRLEVHLLLWLSLIIQPVVIALNIEQKSAECNHADIVDSYSHYEGRFLLPTKISPFLAIKNGIKQDNVVDLSSAEYYENKWLSNLELYIYPDYVQHFITNQLILFDNSIPEDEFLDGNSYAKLAKMWSSMRNLVVLPLEGSMPGDFHSFAPHRLKAQVVYEASPVVKVILFDANTLRLHTTLDHDQFLFWTNGYHPGWHVYIDGRETRLLRADYAFKGAWIPSGDHTVVFRYGTALRYAFLDVLLLAFAAILVLVVVLGVSERFLVEKEAIVGF